MTSRRLSEEPFQDEIAEAVGRLRLIAEKQRGFFGHSGRPGQRGGSAPRIAPPRLTTERGKLLPPHPKYKLVPTGLGGGAAYAEPISEYYFRAYGHTQLPKLTPDQVQRYFKYHFPGMKQTWSEVGPDKREITLTLWSPKKRSWAAALHVARIWHAQGRLTGVGSTRRRVVIHLANPNYDPAKAQQQREARWATEHERGIQSAARALWGSKKP